MQDAPDDLHQGKWFVPLALLAINASFSCGCGRRNTFLSRHTIVMSVGREREEKLNSALAASKAYGVILRSMHTCLGKHLQAAEGCSHLCSRLPSEPARMALERMSGSALPAQHMSAEPIGQSKQLTKPEWQSSCVCGQAGGLKIQRILMRRACGHHSIVLQQIVLMQSG